MVLPVFFIANLGRIIPIAVGIGTALARFVAKNPKIIGTTLSLQGISDAIQSHEVTEKEKRRRRRHSKNYSGNHDDPENVFTRNRGKSPRNN